MGITVTQHSFNLQPVSPEEFVQCKMVGNSGLVIHMASFISQIIVKAYKGNKTQDYPPTPDSEESWRIGLVQNVLQQTLNITWLDSAAKAEKKASFPGANQVMLDASDDARSAGVLPFYMPMLVVKEKLFESFIKVSYGANLDPVFVDEDLGYGPQEYTLSIADQPLHFIFSFKGGGPTNSKNPILEIQRTMKFQLWVVAVRKQDMANKNKYYILGYFEPFSVSCSVTRRQKPDDLCWFDPFDTARDAKFQEPGRFVSVNNLAEQKRSPRPEISGDLSADPIRSWMKKNEFAP